jgi:hypothetical protein
MLTIHRLIFWEESVVIWVVAFAIITGVATRAELKQFVKRLEYAGLVGVFDVEAGELPGSRLRDDIKAGNIQVSLAVKGTNRQIETYKDLAEVPHTYHENKQKLVHNLGLQTYGVNEKNRGIFFGGL